MNGRLNYGVNIFYIDGKNLIMTLPNPNGSGMLNQNSGKIDNTGIELQAAYRINRQWSVDGNYSYLELSGLNLHYYVTDFKTMQKIGGRVSHELNHGNTYRPIGITDWSDIDLSLGKMGPETHIVGRTDDSGKGYAPHYTGTRKKDRSSGLDDIISDSRKTFKPHTGSHRPRKSGGDCTSLSKVISKPGNAPTHQYRKPASKPTTGRFAARAVSTARVSESRDSKGSRDSSRSPRTGDSRFRKRH